MIAIEILGLSVVIDGPEQILRDIAVFFHLVCKSEDAAHPDITISQGHAGQWRLQAPGNGTPVIANKRGEILTLLLKMVAERVTTQRQTALRAACIAWMGRSALIFAPNRDDRTLFTAWAVNRGFAYLADSIVGLDRDLGVVTGFPGPALLSSAIASDVCALPAFRNLACMASSEAVLVRPESAWCPEAFWAPCGLVIVPEFVEGSALLISALSAGEANDIGLAQCARPNGPSLDDLFVMNAVVTKAPAVRIIFGDMAQLDGVADHLIRYALENEISRPELEQFLLALSPGRQPAMVYPRQTETERVISPRPKLTIGMATYDDYDGVYFSIQALRLYHCDVMDQVELLVVDNHPDGACAEALKELDRHALNLRYIPQTECVGTAVRDFVFREAAGDFVLCMDCHVLLAPGAVRSLLDYFAAHPATPDLLQGPLLIDSLGSAITRWNPEWSNGMFGVWAPPIKNFRQEGEPFEIPIMGLGLFACRKSAWVGFNPMFRGFGGEEGYLHEKFRRAGARTLCLPSLAWLHRFRRPMGIPYAMSWQDRIRNYIIGWSELGLPLDEMRCHMSQLLGEEKIDKAFEAVEFELSARMIAAPGGSVFMAPPGSQLTKPAPAAARDRTPQLSVLMPVYNGARFVQRAMDSILGQTLREIEFVIVNDGSGDNTAAILDAASQRDPRIIVAHLPKNGGISAALNHGLGLVTTDLVARMDADDIALPDRLERQLQFLTPRPDVGVLGGRMRQMRPDGSLGDVIHYPEGLWRFDAQMLAGNPIGHPSVMMRASIIRKAGGYRSAFDGQEDYDLWIRASQIARIGNIGGACLVHYRFRSPAEANIRRSWWRRFLGIVVRACGRSSLVGAGDPMRDRERIDSSVLPLLMLTDGERADLRKYLLNSLGLDMDGAHAGTTLAEAFSLLDVNWLAGRLA
jgi:glycosyltransferase involved in cell wall biosynthesis